MNKYERLVAIEDEIYDSDVLHDYNAFIWKCINFTKEKIIPLAENKKYLNEKLKYSINFMEGNFDKTELQECAHQFAQELSVSNLNEKETKIKGFVYWLLDYDFLKDITPEEQQDRTLCYVLSDLYDIQNSLVLCEEFFDFIMKS